MKKRVDQPLDHQKNVHDYLSNCFHIWITFMQKIYQVDSIQVVLNKIKLPPLLKVYT